MTDFSLGFSVDTSALKQASADAAKAAAEVGKLGDAEERLGKSADKAAQGTRNASNATKEAEASAQRYIRSLEMEARAAKEFDRAQQALNGALQSGRINAQQHANFMRQVGDAYQHARREAEGFRNAAPQGGGGMGLGEIGGTLSGLRGALSGGPAGIASGATEAAGAISRLGAALGPTGIALGAVAAGAFVAQQAFTKLILPLAAVEDRFTAYQSRINLVLKDQEASAEAMNRVIDNANKAGIGIDAAMGGFERILRNKDSLAASTEQIITLMDTVQKLGAISNTSQGEMQGAMIQFSQAIASGRLNGDELRSIMESMPPLAKAIADGLGVGVGQLRAMGAAGELTGDKVFKALLSQTEKVNADFEKLPDTTERAMTRMGNQWDLLKLKIAEALNSSDIARGIIGIGERALKAANDAFDDASVSDQVIAKTKQLADAEKALADERERYNRAKAQGGNVDYMAAGLEARSRGIERLRGELDALNKQEGEQRSKAAAEEAKLAKERRDKFISDQVAKASEYDKEMKKQREYQDEQKNFGKALDEVRQKRAELHDTMQKAAQREIEAAGRVTEAYRLMVEAFKSGDAAKIKQAAINLGTAIGERAAARQQKENAAEGIKEKEEQIRVLGVGLDRPLDGSKKSGGGKSAIQTLREQVADLRKAMAEEAGGGIDMMLQALRADRDAKGTGAETRKLLTEQAALQAQREIENLRRQTAQQNELTAAIGKTGPEIREIEIAQAAANWQYEKFGKQTGPEVIKAVAEYTDALRKQKEATDKAAAAQQVLDARLRATQAWQMTAATGNPREQNRIQFEASLEKELRDFKGTPEQKKQLEDERRSEFRAKEAAQQIAIRDAQDKQLKSAQDRLRIAGLSTEEYEIQLRLLEKAAQLEAQGYRQGDGFYDEIMAREEENARREQKIEKASSRTREWVRRWEQAADQVGDVLSQTFEDAYQNGLKSAGNTLLKGLGKIFKELGNQLVYEIAIRPTVELVKQLMAIAAQKLLASIFGGAIGGGDGGSTGAYAGLKAANGAAFGAGGYRAFAGGGAFTNAIVSQPTLFAFAGGTGLMGEAGPEAIMPLKRGANGKLGVEAAGGGDGGTTIVINDMRSSPNAEQVQTSEQRGPNGKRVISVMIRDEVRRQIRSGDLDRDMGSSYGATRTLARK